MNNVLGKPEGEELFSPGIIGEDGSGAVAASFEAQEAYREGKEWAEQWDKKYHGQGFPGVMLFPAAQEGVKGHKGRRSIWE